MKKQVRLLITLCVAAVLGSCSFGGGSEDTYTDQDLIGRWKAPSESDIDPEGNYQYCVFLADKDETGEFRYGYMWDMGDNSDWDYSEGTYEDFLLNEEYHGNGWFQWKLTKDNLMEYHFMSEGWATIPKSYTITVLNATTLSYKDSFNKSHTWTKDK